MRGRVLITREPTRSAELIDALQKEGIKATAEPVTYTERIADPASLPELSRLDWIAFTSIHGVEIFSEILTESGHALPADTRLAAVGPSTREMIRAKLRAREVVTGTGGASNLAGAIISKLDDIRKVNILWPCAKEALPGFLEILEAAGASVIKWPVYSTEPVFPSTLRSRLGLPSRFDVVVFAAPSAVMSLKEAWPPPWPFAPVAIGETTSAAVHRFAHMNCVTSRSTRITDLIGAIKTALNSSIAELLTTPPREENQV